MMAHDQNCPKHKVESCQYHENRSHEISFALPGFDGSREEFLMSCAIIGAEDARVQQLAKAMGAWQSEHVRSEIAVKRVNDFMVNIRVIDPDFQGMNRGERHDKIWEILETVPDEIVEEVSVLLLLTPSEANRPFADAAFDTHGGEDA
jgi:stress-induced morphogen